MMEVENNNKKATPKKLTISFKGMELQILCSNTVYLPLARKPTLPEGYETETWEILKSSIVAVQRKQPVSFSKEELYKVWFLQYSLIFRLPTRQLKI